MAVYDDTASIGKLYRRQDEIGTPWCVTVDVDSLEDGAVTVRDRDSMAQERVPVEGVKRLILDRLAALSWLANDGRPASGSSTLLRPERCARPSIALPAPRRARAPAHAIHHSALGAADRSAAVTGAVGRRDLYRDAAAVGDRS